MTLRHLKVFQKIANCNSITKASKELFIAQPSVSQTLCELEKYYNVKLFERLNHRLYITQAGEKLLEYCNHILALNEEMEQVMYSCQNKKSIKVGATLTIGTCLLPTIAKDYAKIYDKQIVANINNAQAIERDIISSSIDIGLIEGEVNEPNIISIPFFDDEIVYFSSNNNQALSFALREDGSITRKIVEQDIANNKYSYKNYMTIASSEAIINLVKNGCCDSALSRLLLNKHLLDNEIVIKDNRNTIKRQFFICYHKNKFIDTALQEFICLMEHKFEIARSSQFLANCK